MAEAESDRVFETYEEMSSYVKAENQRLTVEDPSWCLAVADSPSKGEIGYSFTRAHIGFEADDFTLVTDNYRRCVWRPFGVVEPCEVIVPSTGLTPILDALSTMMAFRCFKCDSAKARTMGIVHFDEPGKARTLRFSLSMMKQLRRHPEQVKSPTHWVDIVPTLWLNGLRPLRSMVPSSEGPIVDGL